MFLKYFSLWKLTKIILHTMFYVNTLTKKILFCKVENNYSDTWQQMVVSQLMLLAFTTRRMVRSGHLTLSPIRFTAQFDFAVSDWYSYKKMHTASLGTARLADLDTRHHIKLSPKGSGLMWKLVPRWAHPAFPTMLYAYNLIKHSKLVRETKNELQLFFILD